MPAGLATSTSSLRRYLPSGSSLPDAEFERRHRLLLGVLWFHVPALFVFGLLQHVSVLHALLEGSIVAVPAVLAQFVFSRRKQVAALVAIGLITASAITVHLADGYIEAHFHFFVMIVALTLYEDWQTFGIAAGYVLLHHGVAGVLAPESVYNHADAVQHPWLWAGVHAAFVAAAGVFAILSWRFSEDVREQQADALARTRAAEAQATAAAEDLARSNRDLERFAYVASHDLREPLRTVSQFIKLLERRYGEQLDDDGREFISWAVDGSARMQAMIDDLLEFSKVGRQNAEPVSVDLHELTREVLTGLHAQIADKQAQVSIGAMPEVRADRGQLAQVLQNLLSNAIKFTDQRAPAVAVSSVVRDGVVEVAVEDNGIGIEPAHRDRVFDMFRRLNNRDEYDGTGIGLAVCQRVIEGHGGRIWIETPQSGIGTRFVFSLPLAGVVATAAVTPAAARPA